MLRRLIAACVLCLGTAASSFADPLGHQNSPLPYGFRYSPSSSPFEAFEWTPLEFAAFSAYGGDFANLRKPVTPVYVFEEPFPPPGRPGPDDEQEILEVQNLAYFEELPQAPRYLVLDEGPGGDGGASAIPEPGVLALIGIGLLGASNRLRRRLKNN